MGGSSDADPALERAVREDEEAREDVDARTLLVTTASAVLAGRDDAMAEIGGAVVADARARGAIGVLPGGLNQVSWAETMLGRYRDARFVNFRVLKHQVKGA